MRAGLLSRSFISVWRLWEEQTPSGQIKKTKKEVCKVRCYVKSQKGGEKEESKDIFDSREVIFQIRYNPYIKDSDFLTYQESDYKITFIKDNIFDHTKEITAQKINK